METARVDPMRQARTLAEAHLYLTLVVAAEEAIGNPATLTEGQDAWTLSLSLSLNGPETIEVAVGYESEAQARRQGLTFGAGTSELIDPGQWMQLSAAYARQALAEALRVAQDPSDDQRFERVVEDWEFARDTAIEAANFLPQDAEAIPADTFWTPSGHEAYRESPHRFTRARIADDVAFHHTVSMSSGECMPVARRRRSDSARRTEPTPPPAA